MGTDPNRRVIRSVRRLRPTGPWNATAALESTRGRTVDSAWETACHDKGGPSDHGMLPAGSQPLNISEAAVDRPAGTVRPSRQP